MMTLGQCRPYEFLPGGQNPSLLVEPHLDRSRIVVSGAPGYGNRGHVEHLTICGGIDRQGRDHGVHGERCCHIQVIAQVIVGADQHRVRSVGQVIEGVRGTSGVDETQALYAYDIICDPRPGVAAGPGDRDIGAVHEPVLNGRGDGQRGHLRIHQDHYRVSVGQPPLVVDHDGEQVRPVAEASEGVCQRRIGNVDRGNPLPAYLIMVHTGRNVASGPGDCHISCGVHITISRSDDLHGWRDGVHGDIDRPGDIVTCNIVSPDPEGLRPLFEVGEGVLITLYYYPDSPISAHGVIGYIGPVVSRGPCHCHRIAHDRTVGW